MYNSSGNVSDFARTKAKRSNMRCDDTSDTIPCTANSGQFSEIDIKEVIGMLKSKIIGKSYRGTAPTVGN